MNYDLRNSTTVLQWCQMDGHNCREIDCNVIKKVNANQLEAIFATCLLQSVTMTRSSQAQLQIYRKQKCDPQRYNF